MNFLIRGKNVKERFRALLFESVFHVIGHSLIFHERTVHGDDYRSLWRNIEKILAQPVELFGRYSFKKIAFPGNPFCLLLFRGFVPVYYVVKKYIVHIASVEREVSRAESLHKRFCCLQIHVFVSFPDLTSIVIVVAHDVV